ncbi:ATP-binding cassette domain-containing protein [Halarcobacter anaerophilus]|uniref:ABC transporter ATP-binding protein n=1 Tax=Halarcobacter anaerophilus TaxID=877500 RepID=A0A4Q0XYY8_9BACT|nr:ATP-binding cassette domain-containing protein [Halarcobacter anaerophilus]QDF29954.1 putative dipeptide/oligopeptide/nickel ABC transporter, ATP-binding protein [Halarcobacter anaerophilus]RXJ62916.1 ABC transporter ATP-binding protein [Halarcobacter anaerophilus]
MTQKVDIKRLQISTDKKNLVDLCFDIDEATALIGQSGSGKSLTLKSILNLLPSNLKLDFEVDSPFELNSNTIGFIPQNPFTSLSPMTKIKNQFFCSDEKKEHLMQFVGLDKKLLERFPNQLSGGQLQRAVIAIAFSNDIKLLLLDEPTTALDEKSKQTILNLLHDLQKKLNFLTLFVTHDINSIKNICKNIVIIKDGKVIEKGDTKSILSNPKTSYTKELINSTFENKEFRK